MEFPVCPWAGPTDGPPWEYQKLAYRRAQRDLAKWLKSVADIEGVPTTFKGQSVEFCVLVKKSDWDQVARLL